MGQFHIIQTGFLTPTLARMQKEGVNTDLILKKGGLNQFKLDKEEGYLPLNSVYTVFEEIYKKEGPAATLDIVTAPAEVLEISDFVKFMLTQPDLLSACQFASKYDQIMISNEKIELEIWGNRAKFSFIWTDQPSQGRVLLELYSFKLVVLACTLATGNIFTPTEVHLTHNTEPDLDRLLPAGHNTKIYLNQPAFAVVFPSLWLTYPMKAPKDPDLSIEPERPDSLTKKISALFDTYGLSVLPGIHQVATVADISTRTLQRRLMNEGTSFYEIVERWRIKTAIEMLHDPKITIKEVCEQLRYANLSNFNRAFHRWVHTSPMKYREKL